MKAIETKYKGYRFRSRLEARWAVFFDALKIKWAYEAEGFDLGNGIYYLPDFTISVDYEIKKVQIWLEMKGQYPTDLEIKKLYLLSKAKKSICLFFIGVPGDHSIYLCNALQKELSDCMEKVAEKKYQLGNILGFESEPFYTDSIEVSRAIDSARAARFEHGENVNE